MQSNPHKYSRTKKQQYLHNLWRGKKTHDNLSLCRGELQRDREIQASISAVFMRQYVIFLCLQITAISWGNHNRRCSNQK